eukprot:m.98558 g.98558  ORF g.98558 m.98558 type:complete len:107 (-) comp13126_c0_seq2:2863-3183(-)
MPHNTLPNVHMASLFLIYTVVYIAIFKCIRRLIVHLAVAAAAIERWRVVFCLLCLGSWYAFNPSNCYSCSSTNHGYDTDECQPSCSHNHASHWRHDFPRSPHSLGY